ncbi:M23 family metallopeptidase [Candidatus Saccharibacteria bacterium]|nr:M23 family metallopeptidase [Candidatus Saccharibacteria bacterium]
MQNLTLFRAALSFKRELWIVLGSIFFILCLPALSVVVLANAGVAAVSQALVSVNESTKEIEIRNPSGTVVRQLAITSTWPVSGIVTQEFGNLGPWYDLRGHTGIDIASVGGKIGQPITAFMPGTVSTVVNTDNKYGRYVFVDHGDGIVSQYWHLSNTPAKVGQVVKPGDIIGYEGNTGISTGPHLHFEIQVYGVPVNPRSFVGGNPERTE